MSRYSIAMVESTSVHVVLVAGVLLAGSLRGCRIHKEPAFIPISVIAGMPEAGGAPEPAATGAQARPQPPAPPREEENVIERAEVQRPKPKPEPKKVEVSQVRVRRPLEKSQPAPKPQPRRTALTETQIREALQGAVGTGASGARIGSPSGRYSGPVSETMMCYETIRQAFYRAWLQPSTVSSPDVTAVVEIGLERDGSISSRLMVRPSGVADFDASVMQAVESVPRVSGLTPDFLSSHRSVSVTFKLDKSTENP